MGLLNMRYRRMGQTGLKLSEIALGSSILYPENTENSSKDVGIACIRRAFELGVNLFDTADAYERGETERVLGDAIRDLPREQIVVATKCWFPVWPGPLGRGLSRKHVVEAVEASLKRLGIDYIDLYQAHKFDEETPIEETLAAFDLLVRHGKVLYVGCSNFSAVQLCDANHKARARGNPRFDCIQSCYHMLDCGIETDLLPLCRDQKVGVIVYSPLARSMLSGKYKTSKIVPGSSVAVAPAEWRRRFFTAESQNYRCPQPLRPGERIALESSRLGLDIATPRNHKLHHWRPEPRPNRAKHQGERNRINVSRLRDSRSNPLPAGSIRIRGFSRRR